ncbi:MAG: alpha/beta fold hydrolase [Bacteroidia bacterium]|nr:alpha/beta fold hydrolase [Bacteroidia bacterium]
MDRWIVYILFVFALCGNSCTFQKLFYHPDIKNNENRIKDYSSEEVNIPSKNGKKINGLFIKPNVSPLATILFLHGNAGNIGSWKKTIEALAKNSFQTFIFDYQGFGKSEGVVKHKNLLSDAEAALIYLKGREDVKNTKLIVMGMSIGGHLACALTNKHQDNIHAMVIEGAFTTHNEIATYSMPWFIKPIAKLAVISKYKAKKNIKGIKIHKLIVHSTEDEIIPFKMGKKLFENAVEPKQFWEIKGKHIHGILDYQEEYMKRLKELIGCK